MASSGAESALLNLACDWQRKGHLREFCVLGTTSSSIDELTVEVARTRTLLPWELVSRCSLGLFLNDVHLGTRSLEFFEAVQHDHALSSLHLNRIPVGSEHSSDVKRLAKALEMNSTLEELHLNDCGIGDRGMDVLVTALRGKGSLRGLDLESGGITEIGVHSLCTALSQGCTLTELNLFSNSIGDGGASYLAGLLSRSGPLLLEKVNVAGCDITDVGGKALAAALVPTCSLRVLNLAANRVGDATVTKLCESLARGACLEELNIEGTEVTDESAERLGALLEDGPCLLQVLHVSGQSLSNEGVGYLTAGFESSSSMRSLHANSASLQKPSPPHHDVCRFTASCAATGVHVSRAGACHRDWVSEAAGKIPAPHSEVDQRVEQLLAELEDYKASAQANIRKRLDVFTPNGQAGFAGIYVMEEDVLPNGLPLWKQEDPGDGQERYLFSGPDGKWYFGTEQQKTEGFRCATGYIHLAAEHDGRMPYRMEGVWSWWDGLRWHADPAIVVTTEQVQA